MPEENALILHMHELLLYLNRQGAATFMTVAQHGLVGDMKAPVDVTYLADTVILLRYFEALGMVRRAMRSEEHTSELQSHSDLHSFPTRRSSDLWAGRRHEGAGGCNVSGGHRDPAALFRGARHGAARD